jgi:class 3 adenylate cyclase/tetratricopeptide (TPR) repeat protein
MATAGVLCSVVVGREDEISTLEDALLEALRGDGGVVLLGGDAGMGKSRLVRELSDRATRLGCAVLAGACSEAELALPYLPFLEAVGNHLSAVDLAALRSRLGTSAEELAHLFPQLGRPADTGVDPMQAKLRLFEALLAVLLDAAGPRGLLLVLEDLHWADPSTRELLDYLARRLRTSRVLILATYRTDELHRKHPLLPVVQAWKRSGQASVIELAPLTPEGVAAMVAAMFDERRVSDEFRDFLHERCEGNPFVVEEMLRDARDRGDIFQTAKGWDRADIADLRLRIPQSVRDTILLRLERLAPEEVEVLSAASVIGRSVDLETLCQVTGKSPEQVLAALQVCVQQQLLEEERKESGTFRFRHALTREAVYEDMVVPRRQQLHRRVAEALSALPGRPAIDLAHHLLLAGRYEEAVEMCITAAESALAARAYRDAADLFERAAPHVGDPLRRGRLLARAADASWNNAESLAARRALDEAIPLIEAAGEAAEAAHWRVLLGRCHWELQRSDLARAEYTRALAVLEPLGPSEPLAIAHIRLAGTYGFNGEFDLAGIHVTRALEAARAAGAGMAEAWALNFAGINSIHSGEVAAGLAELEESYRASLAGGHHFQTGNALFNAAWVSVHLGRPAEARKWLARLEASANQGSWVPYLVGLVGLFSGEVPAAIALAREALRQAQAESHEKNAWRCHVLLAHALAEADLGREAERELPPPASRVDLQDATYDGHARIRVRLALSDPAGALAEARAVPERACDLGSPADAVAEAAHTEPSWLAGFLAGVGWLGENLDGYRAVVARAWLALAEDRPADARALFESSIEGIRATGFLLDAWHASRGLARAIHRSGDASAAAAILDRVIAEADTSGARLAARLVHETAVELGLAVSGRSELEATPEAAVPTGERFVTVLFADVRGFTALSGATAPAEIADRIGALQRWVTQEVQRHRGLVDKFAGDAVMATFNVAGASVDHTLQALQAGMAICDKAALMGLPVGVSIAVGPAVVGRLAPGANLSVLGDATNLASRLQAEAGAAEVLLSGEAYRRVSSWMADKGLGAAEVVLTLKGIASPVTAYRLAAPVAGRR